MPTNLFDSPKTLRQRSAGNLGFDVPSMIQGQVPQIMQDVEERRQMGRKKYAEDILQQQLQSAAQELQNRAAGYHLGQEQQYYDNPTTSKMFQDYLGRMGFGTSTNAPINNPHQIKDIMDLQHQALGQEASKDALAMHLLQYGPTMDPAVVDYARKNLGITTPIATNAPPAKPPPSSNYDLGGAFKVFSKRAIPSGVGAGSAMVAGMKTPGPWYKKLAAGTAAGGLTALATKMALGEPTEEEEKVHPWASGAGDLTGLILGTLGGKKLGGTVSPTIMGPNTGVPASIMSRLAKLSGRGQKPPVSGYAGKTMAEEAAGTVAPPTAPVTPPPSVPAPVIQSPVQPGSTIPPYTVPFQQPIQMPQPVATPPAIPMPTTPGVGGNVIQMTQPGITPPPVSAAANIPGPGNYTIPFPQPVPTPSMAPVPPIPSTKAPGISDPALMEYIRRWFQGLPPPGPSA